MGLQTMKARVANGGSTLLEEQIKDAQESLAYGFYDDVSYNPNMVLYKTETHVPIKVYGQGVSASYGTVASFLTAHDNPLELGQMLYDTKKDEYWLCVESYNVAGIHCEGKLAKCMRWLKWQDDNGVIQEFPMIVTSASKYNNGEREDEVLSIGSDQLLVFIQLNDDTLKLDRGKKFFVDERKDIPTTYELTRTDTALYTFMGKGFLSMILTECAYTASEDDLKYGVCDYVAPDVPNTPDEATTLEDGISGNISGNKSLKVGFERTYTANLVDANNSKVNWSDEFYWNIYPESIVTETVDGDKVNILAEDEAVIGSTVRIEVRYRGVLVCGRDIKISEAF